MMETRKEETKMVYVTKYALTKGIEYIEVVNTHSEDMVRDNGRYPNCFHKGEWFENKQDAIEKAEEMRIKKLQSLDKQIKKISKLKFEL